MSSAWTPFIWVAITIPLLLFFQRWIHRHLHGVALLLTGNKNWALILYAIILLPGVFLHEISHWLAAKLLGVRTGSLSILPKTKADGTIQLGYVEYYKSDDVGPIRESIVGSAPLITGTVAVLLIALHVFDIPTLAATVEENNLESLTDALGTLFSTGDILFWLYLIFAISNAMMPSASDRKAWPAFALIMVIFAVVLYLIGFTDRFVDMMAGPASIVFGNLGLAYSLAIGVDLIFIMIIFLVEWLVSRIRGVDLVYGSASDPSRR